MRKLKEIMRIKSYDERVKKLVEYARELGVSLTRIVNANIGKTEENIVYERIQQALSLRQGHKTWMIALASSIASIFSAIAAWVAVFLK